MVTARVAQGACGCLAALLPMLFVGCPLAFAQDRMAGGRSGAEARPENNGFNSGWALAAGSCPTRFDYVVLASFADAPNLLSLSNYRFRSETGFSSVPLTGLQRVAYTVELGGAPSARVIPVTPAVCSRRRIHRDEGEVR